jgi:hypothetical protein
VEGEYMKVSEIINVLHRHELEWHGSGEFEILLPFITVDYEYGFGVLDWSKKNTFTIVVSDDTGSDINILSGYKPYTVNWNYQDTEHPNIQYGWYNSNDESEVIKNKTNGSINDCTYDDYSVIMFREEN